MQEIPKAPGVYIFKDKFGKPIYVGKAKNLRKRAKSLRDRKEALVKNIARTEYIVVRNEGEALVLENNLIKQFKPKYNIYFKDDKTYPYIKITNDKWPRLAKTRKIQDDGADYFGPYPDVASMNRALSLLKKFFKLRTCRTMPKKVCLYYHIGLCFGPCEKKVRKKEYLLSVEEAKAFLLGNSKETLKEMEKEMKRLSMLGYFERAKEARDDIFAIKRVTREQFAEDTQGGDEDYVSLNIKGELVAISVLQKRKGKIVGKKSLKTSTPKGAKTKEILESFIQQYFNTFNTPRMVILPIKIPNTRLLEKFLEKKRGTKVRITTATTMREKTLLSLSRLNAQITLDITNPVLELKEALKMDTVPQVIEGFDVSNIGKEFFCASSVQFRCGEPEKSQYRMYRLKAKNDYDGIFEVVKRRYKKYDTPDLIIIDGGIGQLGAAAKALQELGVDASVISIAKKEEKIFAPWMSEALRLGKNSKALHLVQRVRDEAHRFAIRYNKTLREKKMRSSPLLEIKGVGPKTRLRLLKSFGSLEKIRAAKKEELSKLVGKKLGKKIFEHFHKKT